MIRVQYTFLTVHNRSSIGLSSESTEDDELSVKSRDLLEEESDKIDSVDELIFEQYIEEGFIMSNFIDTEDKIGVVSEVSNNKEEESILLSKWFTLSRRSRSSRALEPVEVFASKEPSNKGSLLEDTPLHSILHAAIK